MIQQNTYKPKGPNELEYLKLTGKSQMRIGRNLKKTFTGLNREQMAERLTADYARSHGMLADVAQASHDQSVVHSFVLRPGRSAKIQVPVDLNRQEAQRLIKFIEILPAE